MFLTSCQTEVFFRRRGSHEHLRGIDNGKRILFSIVNDCENTATDFLKSRPIMACMHLSSPSSLFRWNVSHEQSLKFIAKAFVKWATYQKPFEHPPATPTGKKRLNWQMRNLPAIYLSAPTLGELTPIISKVCSHLCYNVYKVWKKT